MQSKYIGKGIYSISEVSKLTGLKNVQVLRWTYGYAYKYKNEKRNSPAIIEHDYEKIGKKGALSFLDLIQIIFIKQFRDYGVSVPAIRIAAKRASELMNFSHPFATHKFFTDKRTIIAQIASETNEPELIDLVRQQYEMNEIVNPLLVGGIDFLKSDVAQRWWPQGKESGVVLDPNLNFGKPTVEAVNIPTEILVKSYEVHGSFQKVAEWYEIEEKHVAAALNFESSLVA